MINVEVSVKNVIYEKNFHYTENHFFFPDVLKRWSFQKNRAGIWSFLYYWEIWYFFFPKIWPYPRRKMKDDLSQINTRKYDTFFKCSEKMVFSKRTMPGHDLSCTIWEGAIFFPKTWCFFPGRKTREGWPSPRNTWKDDIFYLICSMPSCEKNIKHDPILQKYTWRWLTFQIDTLEKAPAILCTFMETFTSVSKYCCSAKKTMKLNI